MGKHFAITSSGKTLKSFVDLRFGTCRYLVIHSPGDEVSKLVENPFREESEPGMRLAEFLKENEITSIITGGLGLRESSYLAGHKIQLIVLEEDKIQIEDVLARLG